MIYIVLIIFLIKFYDHSLNGCNFRSLKTKKIFKKESFLSKTKFTVLYVCMSSIMVQLTKEQRVWICLEFARVNNAAEVQRRWPIHFPGRAPPSLTAIRKNVKKLNEESTCHNLNKFDTLFFADVF